MSKSSMRFNCKYPTLVSSTIIAMLIVAVVNILGNNKLNWDRGSASSSSKLKSVWKISKPAEAISKVDVPKAKTSVAVGVRSSKNESKLGRKKIVTYTPFFNSYPYWKNAFVSLFSGECEESRCDVSFNPSDASSADAIIFNRYDMCVDPINLIKKVNSFRKPAQAFIFFSLVGPTESDCRCLPHFKNFFNWTMTYRRDSEISNLFGKFTKRTNKSSKSDIPYVTQESLMKKRHAAWIATTCKTASEREKFVADLKKFIDIDVYGPCGKIKCGEATHMYNVAGKDPKSDPCFKVLHNYSFFMSIENNLCTDYASERLYKALRWGLVPIVYGGYDTKAIAPPHSVIDARDFGTIAQLADYIKKVARNATLYNKYLEWNEDYDVVVGCPYKTQVCDLCKKLHSEDQTRTYADIADWDCKGNVTCLTYAKDFFVNDTKNQIKG